MSDITLHIDNQGRIMLPAAWRRKHSIGASSELLAYEDEDGSLRIETREQGIRRAQALVRRYVAPDASLVDELIRDRKKEARREQAR